MGGVLAPIAAAGTCGAPETAGTTEGLMTGTSEVSGTAGPGAVKATDTLPSTSCSLTCTSSAQDGTGDGTQHAVQFVALRAYLPSQG